MTFIQARIKNPTRSLILSNKASGVAVTKGYVGEYASGLIVNGSSSTTRPVVVGIINETIGTGDGRTDVQLIETFEKDTWIADSTNNSDATHNGQYMVLGANAGVVNNTGTTNTAGIVQQVGVYGAAADKKIIVQFVAQ